MLDTFKGITEQEKRQLIDAIAQITILIAGADGDINRKETSWAKKLARIRSYASNKKLNEFYRIVGKTFCNDLERMRSSLPDDTNARNKVLVEQLSHLNGLLSKLPFTMRLALYESYTSFAKHVAEASGGFFRFMSISGEEKKLMNLPMLQPIGARAFRA